MSQHSKKAVSSLEEAIESMTKERDELDHRIALMQETVAMLQGAKRGPGRPPGSKNKSKAASAAPSNRAPKKKRNWSPEARAAAAERMRKTWRKRKRQAQAG